MDEDERLTITNPYNASLSLMGSTSGEGLPDWLTFDNATGAFLGTPTPSDLGRLNNLRITVSDGTLSSAFSFDLTVLLDTDGDGYPDDCDADCAESGYTADDDDDGDNVPDVDDRFPLISLTVNEGTSEEETLIDVNGNGTPDAVSSTCDEACINLAGMKLESPPTAVDVFAATLKSTTESPQSATVVLEGADLDVDALTYRVVTGPITLLV